MPLRHLLRFACAALLATTAFACGDELIEDDTPECDDASCAVAPAPICVGDSAWTWKAPGRCIDGFCRWEAVETPCDARCVDGACTPAGSGDGSGDR